MVLWVFILTLFGAAVAWFGDNLPPELRARVLAVQGMIGSGFLLFILFTSNPFLREIPAPANGQGLNPVLQDPGLAFHPPFLYLGYVGFSVAFSFAVAALDRGPRRCRLGALGPALDLGRVVRAHHRHRDGKLVGLLHARLGRLVVLGSGRERLAHAVARRHRAHPFRDRRRKARHAQKLDRAARHHHLLAVARRHVPGALGRAHLGACLRGRSAARRLHPRAAAGRGRRLAHALCRARADAQGRRALRAHFARGRAGAQQPAAVVRLRHGVPRHALSALPRRRGRAQGLGGISVLQPHLRAADGAASASRSAVGPLLAWKRGDLLGALQRLWVALAAAHRGRARAAFMSRAAGRCWRCSASGLRHGSRCGVADRMGRAHEAFPRAAGRELRGARCICRARPMACRSRISALPSRSRASPAPPSSRSASRRCARAMCVAMAGYTLEFTRRRGGAGREFQRRPGRFRAAPRRRHDRRAPSRAALLPAAAADDRQDRDPHQFPRRLLPRARRSRRQGRVGGQGLLEAARAVDLDRRR